MKPTVSIIIPVYNTEKYLKRCIDSVLNQNYTDFELILADDGSTDMSGAICDEYAAADSRVRVIHKENSGVSDTRNAAIAQACGTWLQFADSDDWLTPDATGLFVRAAQEHPCDMVIADFYRVVGERFSRKGDIDREDVMTREDFAACMMDNPPDFYYWVIWNKFYRRDLIEQYNLKMDTTVNWCEDFLFNMEYILHAASFYALHAPVYYYRKRKGSLISQSIGIGKTVRMKMMVFEYYNNFYKNIYDEKDYSKKRRQIYRFLLEAARDDAVAPAILPGAQKLKESYPHMLSAYTADSSDNGILADLYFERKLFENYLKDAANGHDLTMHDTFLLLFFSQQAKETDSILQDADDTHQSHNTNHSDNTKHTCSTIHTDTSRPACLTSRKELSEFLGISRSSISRSLQKFSTREYIKITDIHTKEKSRSKKICIELLPSAENALRDLIAAQNAFDAARFCDFTEEELQSYDRLSEKMRHNIIRQYQPFP
ncbi:MAG: glycosyltransferase [Clostridiales bacterium]|nr:glycosyltransferase [Clostridiales bacterium]